MAKLFSKVKKMSCGYKKMLDKQHNCLRSKCWLRCGFLKKTLDKWENYLLGNK